MRQRKPSNSTTRWMLGIGLQPASWSGGGTKSWKKSRQSSNGFPVWMHNAIRYHLKKKSEYARWVITLLKSGRDPHQERADLDPAQHPRHRRTAAARHLAGHLPARAPPLVHCRALTDLIGAEDRARPS